MVGEPTLPSKSFSLFRFIYKHWFWITIIIVLAPAIISSIRIAVETSNPTYPLFQLGLKIGAGDSVLQKDVDSMRTNINILIGMDKPVSGIWKSTVYYWSFFWNVIFRIWGDVMLVFFPFAILYKVVSLRDEGQKYKNFFISFGIFVVYLFVINSVIIVHNAISGNAMIEIPEGEDNFQSYYHIFIYMMPFHGIVSLGTYLIQLIIT